MLPIVGRLLCQSVKILSSYQCKLNSTIYALSSGHGKCGVAVIRVTGPAAASALTKLTSPGTLPPPRLATLRTLRHPQTSRPLDSALTLWFPRPNSFTGEDSVELQVGKGIGGSRIVWSFILFSIKVPEFLKFFPFAVKIRKIAIN